MGDNDLFLISGDIKLCKKVHSTTPENRIIVSLSNGLTIFEDDLDPNEHFWKRLRRFIHKSDEKITAVRYQYVAGMLELPTNKPVYYYMKRQFGNIGFNMKQSFRFGTCDNGETISGYEVQTNDIRPFNIPLSKGGFGVITNE